MIGGQSRATGRFSKLLAERAVAQKLMERASGITRVFRVNEKTRFTMPDHVGEAAPV